MKTRGNHSPHGQCPCWAGQPGPAAPRRHAGVRGASTSPASQLKIENLKTSNFHSAKNSRRRLGAGSRGTPAPGQPRGPARDAGARVVRGRWPRSGRRVAPAPGTAPLPTGMLWDGARRCHGLDGRSCPYRHRLLPLLRPAFRLFTINQHFAAKNTRGRAREGCTARERRSGRRIATHGRQAKQAAPSLPCPFPFKVCSRTALSPTARPLFLLSWRAAETQALPGEQFPCEHRLFLPPCSTCRH